ncbi:GntR family transcriptional regulator [Pseudochelatococcus sp. B33]
MQKTRAIDPKKTSSRRSKKLVQRPSSLADHVYQVLLGQLMSLEMSPGERLTIDNLAREFGVSHTPLREALGRLEAKGLVIKTHLIGYRVAPQLDRAQFEELFDFRLLLEPASAALAAARITPKNVSALESIMQLPSKPDSKYHYRDFATRDAEFHEQIALLSGNTLIHDSLSRLHTHIHIFRLYSHGRTAQEALAEHERILEAFRANDPAAAEAAMREHIEKSRDRVMSVF